MKPDYRKIYTDILDKKFPHKKQEFTELLNKPFLSAIEIIELNEKMFGKADGKSENFNQKYRSYHTSDILRILNYQKKYNLNNTQLANHFKLSRNSVAKWKKMFSVQK